MAFCNRLGSLVRQSVSGNGQAHVASMFNTARAMSSSRLFVGGLSYNTSDQSLMDAFSAFGEVADAKVIVDRDTGNSRGFGFVNFTTSESAQKAISTMDGQDLQGRTIRVNLANDRPSGPRPGGGQRPYNTFRQPRD